MCSTQHGTVGPKQHCTCATAQTSQFCSWSWPRRQEDPASVTFGLRSSLASSWAPGSPHVVSWTPGNRQAQESVQWAPQFPVSKRTQPGGPVLDPGDRTQPERQRWRHHSCSRVKGQGQAAWGGNTCSTPSMGRATFTATRYAAVGL